jgi:hypothetical protein
MTCFTLHMYVAAGSFRSMGPYMQWLLRGFTPLLVQHPERCSYLTPHIMASFVGSTMTDTLPTALLLLSLNVYGSQACPR